MTSLPAGDGSGTRVACDRALILALAAALAALLPILGAHHLPLLDPPGHEARLATLRDMLLTGKGSTFYDFDTFFLPNVAFDLIGLGLSTFLAPETIGRIFFALTVVLTLWGVLALNRVATGRWSAVPLAALLLLYNLISILGFFSYAFGLALVPWALAARLLLERAQPASRFILGAGLGVILLFCHVFDFAIYAVMSGGFALAALARRRIGLVRAAAWALESAPAIVLFFVMSTDVRGKLRYEPDFFQIKLFGIVKSATSGSMTGDVAFVVGALLFLFLIAIFSRTRLVGSFVPGLIGLALLYFILPDKLASGSYVDKRMPIAIGLLFLAGLDVRIRRSMPADALVALVGASLLVKQGALAVLWRSFDPMIDSIVASLDALPAGSVILQAECQPESNAVADVYRERQPSLTHVPALASFDGTRFVPGTWAIAGQQPVSVKPAYRPYYDLFWSFPPSVCAESAYREELRQAQELTAHEAGAGRPAPLYLILLRPPRSGILQSETAMVASGRDYELYAVGNR